MANAIAALDNPIFPKDQTKKDKPLKPRLKLNKKRRKGKGKA
jgi:hypothetical protein